MAEERVPSVVLRSADSSSTSECKLRRTAIGGVVERSEFNVLKRPACAMIWQEKRGRRRGSEPFGGRGLERPLLSASAFEAESFWLLR